MKSNLIMKSVFFSKFNSILSQILFSALFFAEFCFMF